MPTSKKEIQKLADSYGIRVDFEFGVAYGELVGETRLTLPNGKLVVGGATGATIIAEGETYYSHLKAVMEDLKWLIGYLK